MLEVARLAEVKGQRELIRALEHVDATGVLVGRDLEQDGRYEQELRSLARRRVVFAGYRDDVPALLAGCDVFSPAVHHGRAAARRARGDGAGKPVVATAVGGTPEAVVDGETGLLVPPGDVAALAGALNALLRDPERARRIGEAGRGRVEREFSLAASSERVLALYSA